MRNLNGFHLWGWQYSQLTKHWFSSYFQASIGKLIHQQIIIGFWGSWFQEVDVHFVFFFLNKIHRSSAMWMKITWTFENILFTHEVLKGLNIPNSEKLKATNCLNELILMLPQRQRPKLCEWHGPNCCSVSEMVCIVNELRKMKHNVWLFLALHMARGHTAEMEMKFTIWNLQPRQFMKYHTGRQIQMAQELIMMEHRRKIKCAIMFKTAQT